MALTMRDNLDAKLSSLAAAEKAGEVDPDDADAIRELVSAYDAEDATATLPRDLYQGDNRKDGHKKPRTMAGWVERLTYLARDVPLTDPAEATAINEWTTALVKSGEVGGSWVRGIEYAAKKFYRFHGGLGVDPRDITIHPYDGADWDARDMLDADERLAYRTVADHPRDLAVYHLAIYTGQRNTAIRTLRVGDIDIENHEWYFNLDADGLKDIHDPRDPRPLFQAERAVRDWLEYHPDPAPEHYFVTGKPKYTTPDPSTPVTRETIRRTMEKLKERTVERADLPTVTKPSHPHMMRHNFVSTCRLHPDITDADIKFWLGHAPESTVMESTYGHLSSADHNEAGHDAFGVGAATTPDAVEPWDTTCRHCDRVLHPAMDTCESCGTPRGETPWSSGSASAEGAMLNRALVDADPAAIDALAERVAGVMDPEQVTAIAEANSNLPPTDAD